MQLISPLASGMVGCANGSVSLVQRGTSTFATYYTEFEGENAIATSGPVTLDENGRLMAFVDRLVDCTVYDANGTVKARFVAGDNAASVEVISKSFTGTDYESAASGPSRPTTLAAVLDRWNDNAGAVAGSIDWKVLFNGTNKTIYQALASIAGLFFNVKDPAYGAKGDGVANDWAAISAAELAASATGGIVFFPPGTYLINSTIQPQHNNTCYMGAGAAASIIKITADLPVFYYTAAQTKDWQTIRGLSIGATVVQTAASSALVKLGAGNTLHVDDCIIGDANTYACFDGSASSDRLRVTNSTLVFGKSDGHWWRATGSHGAFHGCRMIPPGTVSNQNGIDTTGALRLESCDFELTTATVGGTFRVLRPGGAGKPCHISGCDFQASGGATITVIEGNVGDTNNYEAGNYFDPSLKAYAAMGGPNDLATDGNPLLSRSTREEMQNTDANATANADQNGLTKIKRGAGYAGATTLTFKAPQSPGHFFALVYHNSNAGGVTGLVTVAGPVKGLANFTVNASVCSVYLFHSVEANTNLNWVLVGSQLNFAP